MSFQDGLCSCSHLHRAERHTFLPPHSLLPLQSITRSGWFASLLLSAASNPSFPLRSQLNQQRRFSGGLWSHNTQCGVALFLEGAKKKKKKVAVLHVPLSSSTLTSKAEVRVSCWGLAAASSCLKSASFVIFLKKVFFFIVTALVFLLLYFLDHLHKLSESCHHLNRPRVNTVLQPDKDMLEVLSPRDCTKLWLLCMSSLSGFHLPPSKNAK